ncbi:MAG: glycosyltransferase family 4 protein [Acetobacteraceae bacterium]
MDQGGNPIGSAPTGTALTGSTPSATSPAAPLLATRVADHARARTDARTCAASLAHGPRVLLVANNFPPVRGGSAVVYDTLARYGAGKVIVLAATQSYADGLPLIGWREHDRQAPYKVIRLRLLRTVLGNAPAAGWGARAWFRLGDLAIRARMLATVLRLILFGRVRAVCIGELVSAGWLFPALRPFPFVRRVVYMHGEEITTSDGYDDDFRRRRRYVAGAQRIVAVSRFTRAATARLLAPAGRSAGGAPGGVPGDVIPSPAGRADDAAAAGRPDGDAGPRIVLIENGVDPQRFRPGPKRADLLAYYGIEGAFVFVSVCRLLEKKGIDHAIRAFAAVAAAFPDCRYLVVGDGAFRERLGAIAAEEGVAERVVFTGQVAEEELVDHYRLGDVFVMPNRELANGDTEGFGLVFLEANACGLAVVAGCAGGSPDAVSDGVNGLVVDGRDVTAIGGALQRLRTDGALRAALAARGLDVAAAADWREKVGAFLGVCLG